MNCVKEDRKVKPVRWSRHIYNITTPLGEDGRAVSGCEKHIALSRKIAGEGMVLLENDGTLPLKSGTKVALFGVGSIDYIKGGGGSGEVFTAYIRNLYEGFASRDNRYPIFEKLSEYYYDICVKYFEENPRSGFVPEPEINEELVKEASDFADVAIITIHRNSGEGHDRSSTKGDFYLTDAETRMIKYVTTHFKKAVAVLNIAGMIDVDWIKTNPVIGAALLSWQAGIEGGNATADVLTGDVNPSGKLTDTFAKRFEDYPSSKTFEESDDYVNYYEDIYVGYRYFETIPGAKEKVNYPFGYGLSYTTFEIGTPEIKFTADSVNALVTVKNTGNVAGKEVIQLYFSAPQGKLGKPAVQLAAFKKTALLNPDECETVSLTFPISDMASFDDLGKCKKSAYVLEKGDYVFFAGNSCETLIEGDCKYTVEEEYIVVKQLNSYCAPNSLEYRMLSDGTYEDLPTCPIEKYNPEIPEITVKVPEREKPYMLCEAADGVISLNEFISQFTDDDLIYLTGGHDGSGVSDVGGYGGLKKFGVPLVMATDGPQGVRILPGRGICTTAWPCATLVACTWNPELIYEMGSAGALEVKENGLAVWLTPALNIHRNPLCGRNFEYYSEDPLIAGIFAAAKVNGIQSRNIAASPKHFVCNNREKNRFYSDSRLSERALREIYLRGFEICVKNSHPWTIMSSYNLINGRRCCQNYEQLKLILRDEWGFDGMVTSDWGVPCVQPEMIKAGNDVRMISGYPEQVKAALENGDITRGQLEEIARNVLTLILRLE